jgi:hypothetical protein
MGICSEVNQESVTTRTAIYPLIPESEHTMYSVVLNLSHVIIASLLVPGASSQHLDRVELDNRPQGLTAVGDNSGFVFFSLCWIPQFLYYY